MQQRIGAMLQAALAAQPSLTKFYDLLEDEQEAQLNALAGDRRRMSAASDAAQEAVQQCGAAQPAALQWPADEIEARLRPNDTQRVALRALQDANARAVGMLISECQPDAVTLPARLDAVDGRLTAMGGLHLSGPNEAVISETVEGLREFNLKTIAAGHCTGWRATAALASAFPDAIAPTAVGKQFTF